MTMADPFHNVTVLTSNNTDIKLAEKLSGNVTSLQDPEYAFFLGAFNEGRLQRYLNQDLKLVGYHLEQRQPITIVMRLEKVTSKGLKFCRIP